MAEKSVEHWFYHLQQGGLESILPDILEKTQIKKWRVALKIGACNGEPKQEMVRLDKFLWSYKKHSFLPHGRDDEPMADSQPILLSTEIQDANNADVVILVGGAEIDDVSNAERCITILDGNNDEDRRVARLRWKTAKDDGQQTAYWKQDDYGKWVKPNL